MEPFGISHTFLSYYNKIPLQIYNTPFLIAFCSREYLAMEQMVADCSSIPGKNTKGCGTWVRKRHHITVLIVDIRMIIYNSEFST